MPQHTSFSERLNALKLEQVYKTLTGIQHGVERESLRIKPDGTLSQDSHPRQLGAALTHHFITTDFAESLLEFITPPEPESKTTLAQLADTHKFVLENLGDGRLWPLSMPCFISKEDQIRLAEYGSSNVGRMKNLYRKGLKNRYGSMMQAISGIHFNFSLPSEFWTHYLREAEGKRAKQDEISDAYFALVRNYRRFCWLIPYLYGASPALCGSFLAGKESSFPFQKLGGGSLYLPNATSLRMSDLGYTNNAQSGLFICYNDVDNYVASLRKAINTPSPEFKKFEGKIDGQFQQLNSNVLQIENELYSPIRPKQPTISLEKPTDALAERGVSYIEVRALDVNPFSPVGIDEQQMDFLDVFLLYCLVKPSAPFEGDAFKITEENLTRVVIDGRNPSLQLNVDGQNRLLRDWADETFSEMKEIAAILDLSHGGQRFTNALNTEWEKVKDTSKTFSGRFLEHLQDNNKDNGTYALELAEQHRQTLLNSEYQIYNQEFFMQQAELSMRLQQQMEEDDQISFDQFMNNNFGV